MSIITTEAKCTGLRLAIHDEAGQEIGRASLFIMHNDLHPEPFGLMEDVYVAESARGQGVGTELVREVIQTARNHGCYKLIATSRHSRSRVHELYRGLGFTEHGVEFRIDF